ncbi:MAG: NCS2 family permease, partial [Exiguobacterium profundum]
LPLDNWEHAFPAILVIIMIPFTYSIVDGIGLGFIAYTMIVLFKKGYRSLSPVVGVLTVLFLVFFSLPVWL